jgi:hypothetical protein
MRIQRASIVTAFAAALAVCVAALALLSKPEAADAAPRSFFGIVPQAILSDEDTEYMRAARIGSIRLAIGWDSTQPEPNGEYNWEGADREIANAARRGIDVLPFLTGMPGWVSRRPTRMPIDNARQRRGWARFVRAAVRRYGPGGEFWREHSPAVAKDGIVIRRPRPVRTWQVWNEANFFYFSFPVSPGRYSRLLKITSRAIKSTDRRARVLLAGLFGEPDQGGRRGMDSAAFLARLYRVRGSKRFFDGIALHPYAFHVRDLRRMVERMRAVAVRNRDPGVAFHITEMGWGSQYNPDVVAFEQGIRGQARELRGAYRYLLRNRHRLNLKAAYWFTWKDSRYYCNFCDSVGFFREADRYRPKPAWYAFVRITGGRPRP